MKTLTLTPCQLLALHEGATTVGGACGGDRVIRKALIARGLAKWSHSDEQFCLITDAGLDVIAGRTPFALKLLQTDNGTNAVATALAAEIRRQTGGGS